MNCIDLFAGCGGISRGFELAGFNIVSAYDNWDPAIRVYEENFNHPIYKEDLRDDERISEQVRKLQPDLIMGGPPCQDFSSAGKRDTTLGRADLTYHFANIVCDVMPKWFVMENVERIKKSHILQDVVEQFISSGYGLSSVILDASLCNVPQARTRFFLIGHINDSHNQLNRIYSDNLSERNMTVRDYLEDSLELQFYYRHPRNYNRRGVFSIDEPSPTIRGVNRPVPKGYKLNTCDPSGINLSDIRPLTTIERSYIQTFPKDFNFFGTKTNLEQMIGNAVPVNLGEFVATGIQEYLNHGTRKEKTLFDFIDTPFEEMEQFQIANRTLRSTRSRKTPYTPDNSIRVQ